MKRIISFEENSDNGRNLLAFAAKLKDPEVMISEPFVPLSETDWVTQGSPASTAQIEYLMIENESGFIEANEVKELYAKRKK